MPFQGRPDGLYFLKQASSHKGVDHYGILDIGNRIQHPEVDGIHPVVIHMTPPNLRIDWFQGTGAWTVLGVVADEAGAIQRMNSAFQCPDYHWFGNNCEHFARFVATGTRESKQVQAGAAVAGLALLAFLAIRDEQG